MVFISPGDRRKTDEFAHLGAEVGDSMALYTFYIFKSTSSVASIEVVDLSDDESAVEHACAIRQTQTTATRIEIWQGDRRVAPD